MDANEMAGTVSRLGLIGSVNTYTVLSGDP